MKTLHTIRPLLLACLLSLMVCLPVIAEEGAIPTAWTAKIEKADKSRDGTYQPFMIRVRGLPDMTEEELKTFVIEIQGIQMHLEKHAEGFYYIKGNSLWVLSARKDKDTGKVLVRLWNDVNGNEVIDEGEQTDVELELDKLTSKLIRKTQAGDVPLIIDEKRVGSFDVEIENPAGVTIREEDKVRIDGLLFVNYDADESRMPSPPRLTARPRSHRISRLPTQT